MAGDSFTIKEAAPYYATGYNNQRKVARTSNGDLHCVYRWWDGSYRQIHYAKSTDSGETWVETALTNESYEQGYPSIAVDSSDVLLVVWSGKHSGSETYWQIRYRKYTTSWQNIENLTSESYDQLYSPAIALDSTDTLHVVWWGKHSGSATIWQIRYMKNDGSWSEITNLTSAGTWDQQEPTIEVDSDDYLHVAWNGTVSMEYRRFTDSWQTPIQLYFAGFTQQMPSIAIDSSDNIHVVWFGVHTIWDTTYNQILYRKSLNQGASFETMERLTSDAGYYQNQPSISVDSEDTLHLTWSGKHSGSTTYNQIRYLYYDTTWSTVQDLTSDASEHQYYPNMIWANFPEVDGFKTNRSETGIAFIWVDSTTVKYYRSSDLTWENTMAAITKIWTGEAALEQTAAYGGSDVVVAADQKYDNSADIDLETAGEFGAVIALLFHGSNVKDDLVCDVFNSLDGSTYDTEPYMHYVFKNDGTRRQVSFVIKDLSHCRIGLKSTGTDTTFEYQISYDRWTEDSS